VRSPFGGSAPADWLVVGLGNPGAEYERTPHNVGFQVLAELARRWDLGKPKKKFGGLLAEGRAGIGGPRVGLLQPLTFMNESGSSVGPARGALKVELDRVLVVHDEIDLPFGDIRSRLGGGLAGHNGLKSLKRGLGSPDFAAYVLGRWRQPPAEVESLVRDAADVAERIVGGQLDLPAR